MRLTRIATLFSVLSLFAAPASATPLRLEYTVTLLSSGLYRYDFKVINDNNDGSWVAGQQFRWFIFGDCSPSCSSPLTNFVGDLPSLLAGGGPYTSFTSSGGSHNGPTLGTVTVYWIPTAVGDSFTWSGTSTANLCGGGLLWSTLATDTSYAANLEPAHCLGFCQEDIGFQGPGPALLTVCGGDLSTGNDATLEVTGAAPSAAGYLVADTTLAAFQIFGGTLVGFNGLPISTNPSGGVSLTVPGGSGPIDVYTQYVYLDLSLTMGLGFTNGVKMKILP